MNPQRKSLLDGVGRQAIRQAKRNRKEKEVLTLTTNIPTLSWQKQKDTKILKKAQFLKVENLS